MFFLILGHLKSVDGEHFTFRNLQTTKNPILLFFYFYSFPLSFQENNRMHSISSRPVLSQKLLTTVELQGTHFYCSFVAYVAYYFQQAPSVAVASINLGLTRGYTDSDHNIKSPSCYIAKAWVIWWLTQCLTIIYLFIPCFF